MRILAILATVAALALAGCGKSSSDEASAGSATIDADRERVRHLGLCHDATKATAFLGARAFKSGTAGGLDEASVDMLQHWAAIYASEAILIMKNYPEDVRTSMLGEFNSRRGSSGDIGAEQRKLNKLLDYYKNCEIDIETARDIMDNNRQIYDAFRADYESNLTSEIAAAAPASGAAADPTMTPAADAAAAPTGSEPIDAALLAEYAEQYELCIRGWDGSEQACSRADAISVKIEAAGLCFGDGGDSSKPRSDWYWYKCVS